ncbi:MAG: hypothetical protein U0U70_13105 [Chitinophagaceae bacterium]
MKKRTFLLFFTFFLFACSGLFAQQTGEKKGWVSDDRWIFIKACIDNAREGMSADSARFYCFCMQELVEAKYPDSKDAGKITPEELQLPEWQKNIVACLGGFWKSAEREEFVSNCISSAKEGGIDSVKAGNYCECMLYKIEKLYPDPNKAVEALSGDALSTPFWQKLIKGCLEF